MSKHVIICKANGKDNSILNISLNQTKVTELTLFENNQLNFGINGTIDQLKSYGIIPSFNAFDLLVLASLVNCADTRISRSSESQDNWTREILISMPVHDAELWNHLNPHVTKLLNFLTGDKWELHFRKILEEESFELKQQTIKNQNGFTSTCLFSGGLDSFIGVIDLLESGEKPLLISHSWEKNANHHQQICKEELLKEYGQGCIGNIKSLIGFQNATVSGVSSEPTQRSRSFLFFSLAVIAANGIGTKQVYIPENGVISLNVPLDSLRPGALSTRTTHPFYIARYNELLKSLSIDCQLINPYRFKTKGEMVKECKNQSFLELNVIKTMSCSSPNKARWSHSQPQHCGFCVPCIIRRASLNGWKDIDKTTYQIANLHEKELNCLYAEGDNVRSFQYSISKLNNNIELAKVLIHKSGPLLDYMGELGDYASVYLRGMQEVNKILDGVVTKPYARKKAKIS